mmetsp:Transcript_60321/g.155415  ORF Transcript_60321/g.155415 Transcript_60321/m.155415 type:complete len:201 (+) Transcript_60321:1738-2340(+)
MVFFISRLSSFLRFSTISARSRSISSSSPSSSSSSLSASASPSSPSASAGGFSTLAPPSSSRSSSMASSTSFSSAPLAVTFGTSSLSLFFFLSFSFEGASSSSSLAASLPSAFFVALLSFSRSLRIFMRHFSKLPKSFLPQTFRSVHASRMSSSVRKCPSRCSEPGASRLILWCVTRISAGFVESTNSCAGMTLCRSPSS